MPTFARPPMHATEPPPQAESVGGLFTLSKRTAFGVIVLLIVLYGVGLALSRLPLELFDESRQAVNAIEMRRAGFSLVTTYEFRPDLWNTKPPLLIWLMVGSMRLLGPTLLALRLPSLLASVATVAVVARFSWTTTRRPIVATVAAIVLMASPLFFQPHVALTADYDAVLALFLTVASLAFFRGVHAQGPVARRAWIVCGLAFGAAVLTKGIAGLLALPGLFLYVALVRRWRRVLRKPFFWIAVATTLTIALGFYVLRERIAPGYLSAVIANEVTGRAGSALEGNSGKPWFYLVVLSRSFSLGPLFLVVPFALRGTSPRVRTLGLFATTVAFTLLIVYTIAKTKLFWYATPTLPLFSILSALAADRLLTRKGGEPQRRDYVAATVLLALALVLIRGTSRLVGFDRLSESSRLSSKSEGYRILFDRLKALHPSNVTFVDSAEYTPEYRFYALAREVPGTSTTVVRNLGRARRAVPCIVATCDPGVVAELVRAGRPVEATSEWAIVQIE